MKARSVCLISPNVNQVQMKTALRRMPIDEVVEGYCGCSIKWAFQNSVFKMNAEDVYEKVEKDWGCIPCNIKVADGSEMCLRHTKLESPPKMWERDDLKVFGTDIN